MDINKLKQLFCLIFTVFLCISFNISIFANYKNLVLQHEMDSETGITFNKLEYLGMTDLEAGIAKVNKYSINNNISKNMDVKFLESIGRSQSMSRKSIYLVEELNLKDIFVNENVYLKNNFSLESNLVEVDEETYNDMININNKYQLFNDVIIKDEIGNIIDNPKPFSAEETTRSIDSGKVRMYLESYHYLDENNNYFYNVVNEFVWDAMPIGRGTDIFGISRDSNTAFIPNSANGYYEYLYNKYGGYVSQSGQWNPPLISSEVKHFNCINDDSNNYSSTIRIDMPKDYIPDVVIVGRYYTADLYPTLVGASWYSGTISNISIPGTFSFNHWGTLEHQIKGKLSLNSSASVNYPLGASFSISPEYKEQFINVKLTILDRITVSYQ